MESNGEQVSGGQGGNTKPLDARPNQSKYWCFTWNNYPEDWMEKMERTFGMCSGYIVGREVGSNGTPHLQGYLELPKPTRWSEFKLPKQIHWENRRGTRTENLLYCSKENDYVSTFTIPDRVDVPDFCSLPSWAQNITDLLHDKPNPRTVNWYWSKEGKVGKTQLQRWICWRWGKDAIFVNGQGKDIRCGIALHIKETGRHPKIVVWNIPRCVEHISYTAIEEIKDGLFFSGKYESGMVMMNSPHLYIFANMPPEYEKLSEDRWNVHFIPAPEA